MVLGGLGLLQLGRSSATVRRLMLGGTNGVGSGRITVGLDLDLGLVVYACSIACVRLACACSASA